MLADKDRIFTNLYGMFDRSLAGARARGHWNNTAGIIAIGSQISIESPRIMPVYCGGAMPITVSGCSLSVTVLPMSSGSELKRRCQRL